MGAAARCDPGRTRCPHVPGPSADGSIATIHGKAVRGPTGVATRSTTLGVDREVGPGQRRLGDRCGSGSHGGGGGSPGGGSAWGSPPATKFRLGNPVGSSLPQGALSVQAPLGALPGPGNEADKCMRRRSLAGPNSSCGLHVLRVARWGRKTVDHRRRRRPHQNGADLTALSSRSFRGLVAGTPHEQV